MIAKTQNHRFNTFEGQLSLCLEQLSSLVIHFQHRKGKDHGNADALSRYPDTEKCDCYRAGINPRKLPYHGCKHSVKLNDQ